MKASKHNKITRVEERVFYRLPLFVFAGCVTIELCFAGFSATYAGWPLVLSLVLVGMPHGAVDFIVSSRLRSASSVKDQLLSFVGYCVVLLLSLAAFVIAPSLTLAAFVVASAIHFGVADARDVEKRTAASSNAIVIRTSGLARGAVILALPFALSPAESWQVFVDVMALVGRDMRTSPPMLVQQTALLVCALAPAAHMLVTAWRLRLAHKEAAIVEAIESAMITLAFLVLHPLFAMGLYVVAWHSWRHMQSLSQFFGDDQRACGYSQIARSIARLHVYSLPLLIPTLLIFGVAGWWRLDAWTSEMMAALTIAIFVVVTLPHHLLVEELVTHVASRDGNSGHSTKPQAVARKREVEGTASPVVRFTLGEDQPWGSH